MFIVTVITIKLLNYHKKNINHVTNRLVKSFLNSFSTSICDRISSCFKYIAFQYILQYITFIKPYPYHKTKNTQSGVLNNIKIYKVRS